MEAVVQPQPSCRLLPSTTRLPSTTQWIYHPAPSKRSFFFIPSSFSSLSVRLSFFLLSVYSFYLSLIPHPRLSRFPISFFLSARKARDSFSRHL
jgi:hypothetical protein